MDRRGLPALPCTVLAALCGWCPAWLGACAPSAPAPRTMQLEWVWPRGREGVYLNEDIELDFSGRVDPATVSGRSLWIQGPGKERARGQWSVEGRRVRFAPEPVLARDLSDGGYRPGSEYTIVVAGFPRVDALRGTLGEVLAASLALDFTTATPGAGHQVVFDDASPGWAEPLRLDPEHKWIGPDGALLFTCEEPLDPSSLDDEEYALYLEDELGGPATRVPVRLRLTRNRDPEDVRAGESCAWLEMRPRDPPFPSGRYFLRLPADPLLRDFGGNPVYVQGRNSPRHEIRDILVDERRVERDENRVHLAFLDDQWATPLAVPGSDGTARWSDAGRIEVGYPAAAGDGRDGEIELASSETRRDVRATRLGLAPDTTCTLLPGPGLRVLRSQGRMSLSGTLLREGVADAPPMPLRRGVRSDGTSPAPLALSSWLEEQLREDPSWTVLVAGGDLVIDGLVRVDTPLLLVSGGMIRAIGQRNVIAAENQTWLLGEGRGWGVEETASLAESLYLDPPVENSLCIPLRFAVVSDPVPSAGQVLRWLSVEADGSPRRWQRSAAGGWSVRFLPSDAALDPASAFEHPNLIQPPRAIRLWIELEVRPGPRWDPPFVDFVSLRWEERR